MCCMNLFGSQRLGAVGHVGVLDTVGGTGGTYDDGSSICTVCKDIGCAVGRGAVLRASGCDGPFS